MKVRIILAASLLMVMLFVGCDKSKASQPVYEKINVFDNVTVEISGIAPYAKAEVKLLEEVSWYDETDFSLSKSRSIKNGDLITVSCDVPAERLKEAGYELVLEHKIYAVPNFDMYVNDLMQLSGGALSEIIEEEMQIISVDTENSEGRMLYRLTGNSNYLFQYNKEWIEDAGVYKVILCTPMDYQNTDLSKNIIYIVLKAVAANSDYKEEGYFVFEYKDAIISADGTMYVNHGNAERNYYASSDYDELYQMLVELKTGEYYVGTMDGTEILAE